ncbi:MAG: hypothetical protein MJ147_04165 [Clostridia bacterium]|nr:hypothetical protein [Clostridia bacterium]
MKHSKGFIITVSISIFLLIFLPIIFVISNSKIAFNFYIFSVAFSFIFTLIFGIKNIIKSRQFFKENDTENLTKMWLSLKLFNVPVFILNFIFCVIVISMGFIFFPLNIILTITNSVYVFMCVILTGIVGCFAIKQNKKAGKKIHSACYVFQFIPFWDVICTLIIKGKDLL